MYGRCSQLIDLENDIYTYVAKRLREVHSGISVSGEYVPAPSRFPFVSIYEADNHVLTEMRTTNIENAVGVMWETNIYSNKTAGKKSEAKAILSTMDQAFRECGFTRTFCNPIPNENDATIYRIVTRFEAVIDKDFWIYQN